jgi:hypothetical protein
MIPDASCTQFALSLPKNMRPITFFRQSLLWQYILSLLLVALTMLLSYFFCSIHGL